MIRILPSTMLFDLSQLGYSERHLALLNKLIARPHGIFFVTGPTGSGKSTTLYACLSRLNTPERKIITVEDPVEYQLQGINQIQVHPKIGLTFAHSLRSILRHDPRADPIETSLLQPGTEQVAAGYILWMFKRVFYGEVTNPKNENLPDLSRREAVVLVPLVALALFMGVASPLFTKRIEPAADALVRQVRAQTREVQVAGVDPPPPAVDEPREEDATGDGEVQP